ncbi:hypothetical protein K1719_008229 [Acacia pycnantha]|nr:hypothetical protein K1719_008229 [Acacia pycnantha]
MEGSSSRSNNKRPFVEEDDGFNKPPAQKRVRFPKGKKVRPGDEPVVDKGPVEEDTDDMMNPRNAAKERAKRRSQITTELFSEGGRGIANDFSSAEVKYEDNENFVDDGIQIEPFNLNQEREEGYFDADGNFIEYVRDNEIKDAWLDNVEVDPKYSALNSTVTNDEEEIEDLSPKEIGVMKRRIANALEPGETVLQALRRLKGNNDRKAKMSHQTKILFDQLTEDAMKLMENGEYNVYHEKQEVFQREAEGYEKLALARGDGTSSFSVSSTSLGASNPNVSTTEVSGSGADEFDMFAEDDDTAKPSSEENNAPIQTSSDAQNFDSDGGPLQNDYMYDESSGYYYSSSLGYYYDPNTGLYCSAASGQWYSYNEETGTYDEVKEAASNNANVLVNQPCLESDIGSTVKPHLEHFYFMSSIFRSFSRRSPSSSSFPSSSSAPNSSINRNGACSSKNHIFDEEIQFKDINQTVDDWNLPVIDNRDVFIIKKNWLKKSDYTRLKCFRFSLLERCKTLQFCRFSLAAAEFGLHDGPVYFNCYPNQTVDLSDQNILDVLKLNLKLNGFNMKSGSIPVALLYRVQYKVSNSSASNVQRPPDNGQTVVFLTDHLNTNITIPRTIMWNDVTLPEDWVMDKAVQPIPRPVGNISRISQTQSGSVRMAFDRPQSSTSSISSRYEDFRSVTSELRRHSSFSERSFPSVINLPPPPPPQPPVPPPQPTENQLSNVSIQGINNSGTIPHANYQREDDQNSVESIPYLELGEPRPWVLSSIIFKLINKVCKKNFTREHNTLQRNWF